MEDNEHHKPKIGKKKGGFASMTPEKLREIARKGGKTAHALGRAHEWTNEEAQVAGHKGGSAVNKKVGDQLI